MSERPSLADHTNTSRPCSNDYEWLYRLVYLDGIAEGEVITAYLAQVMYTETNTTTTVTKDFGIGEFALRDLKKSLSTACVRVVVVCHRDSSQVNPEILNLLWGRFRLETSFL